MNVKGRECSLLFDALEGYTKHSKSTENRNGSNEIRLIDSVFSSVTRWYGDELTWDEIATADLIWGDDTTILFPSLRDGWSYIYKVATQSFLVLDDADNIIFSRKTNIISQFGIPWDIISSHQFWIEFAYNLGMPYLLVGKKRRHTHFDPDNPPPFDPDNPPPFDPDNPPPNPIFPDTVKPSPEINAMYGDQYYTKDDTIADLNRIVNSLNVLDMPVLESENGSCAIEHIGEPPTFLRSNVPVHDALGDYSTFLLKRNDLKEPAARTKKRDAMPVSYYVTWLIALVSSSLYGRGDVIYEPWMLFEMWKWLGASTPTSALDKIFDIMPNWGE